MKKYLMLATVVLLAGCSTNQGTYNKQSMNHPHQISQGMKPAGFTQASSVTATKSGQPKYLAKTSSTPYWYLDGGGSPSGYPATHAPRPMQAGQPQALNQSAQNPLAGLIPVPGTTGNTGTNAGTNAGNNLGINLGTLPGGTPGSALNPGTTNPQTPPSGTNRPANQPANQQPSTGTSGNAAAGNNASLAQQVLDLVNQNRQSGGLGALTMDSSLSNMATVKAQDMINNNYFDHNSPTYGSPFDMMKKFNITYGYAGENIAEGQTTASQVMNDWMNSPGHRANIMNGSYKKIGIGYYNNAWVQEFTD